MNKTLISVIIIVSLLVSGCEFLFDEELSLAVKSGDPQQCLALEDEKETWGETRAIRCLKSMAEEQKKEEICDYIEDNEYDYIEDNEYRDECVAGVAVALEDDRMCYRAGDEQNDCLGEIAVKTINGELCGEIEDDDFGQNDCYREISVLTTNDKWCENVVDRFRPGCYYNYAMKTGDAWSCKKVYDFDYADCLIEAVKVSGEEAACEEIEKKTKGGFTNSDYTDCIKNAAIASGKNEVCARLEGSKADECFSAVGKQHNKASACSSINSEVKREECYLDVARDNDDDSICDERIQRTDFKDSCYFEIAKNRESKRWCDEINAPEVKQECLAWFDYD